MPPSSNPRFLKSVNMYIHIGGIITALSAGHAPPMFFVAAVRAYAESSDDGICFDVLPRARNFGGGRMQES